MPPEPPPPPVLYDQTNEHDRDLFYNYLRLQVVVITDTRDQYTYNHQLIITYHRPFFVPLVTNHF